MLNTAEALKRAADRRATIAASLRDSAREDLLILKREAAKMDPFDVLDVLDAMSRAGSLGLSMSVIAEIRLAADARI